jgi:hypothetical protein
MNAGRLAETLRVPFDQYTLEFGSEDATFALFDPHPGDLNSADLQNALHQRDEELPALGAVTEQIEDASTVASKCERCLRLFLENAQGHVLDQSVLAEEVDGLLALLDRLDRAGRHKDAIRLARSLTPLLALLLRWLDLVRSLRSVLRLSESSADEQGMAWALHELGSLHLAAGDPSAASDHLAKAVQLEETLGGEGRCASRHNLDSARRDLAERDGAARVQRRRRLRIVGAGGALLLLGGGGAALGITTTKPSDGGPTPLAPLGITTTKPSGGGPIASASLQSVTPVTPIVSRTTGGSPPPPPSSVSPAEPPPATTEPPPPATSEPPPPPATSEPPPPPVTTEPPPPPATSEPPPPVTSQPPPPPPPVTSQPPPVVEVVPAGRATSVPTVPAST